jgi:membrane protease YdiL (CAAX protease family)
MGIETRVSRWPGAALAGAWGAIVALVYFSPWFFSPYLIEGWKHWLKPGPIFGITAVAALLVAAFAAAFPRSITPLIRVLAATAFIYLVWRMAIPWVVYLSKLSLTPRQHYWVSQGPGSGALGLVPTSIAVLLGGRFLFGMSAREQWNGRLSFAMRDVVYGGTVGVAMSAVALASVILTGAGRVYWDPNWDGHGVNVFSNLYEEILARSLLLQVARRAGGNWFAMIWTGLVFGSMHGISWMALGFALSTWVIAWVVLRAGSLWAGWVFHQTIDVIVDSYLH